MKVTEQDKKAGEIIHETLAVKSDCFKEDGNLKPVKYVVAIDDDITSLFQAARAIRKMHDEGQEPPVLLCVGGKGMLSKWTMKCTEGQNLANFAEKTIPEELLKEVVVLDKGKNNGDNIMAVNDYVMSKDKDANVLFCSTKRLSSRVKLTKDFQAKDLKANYFVVDETFQDVLDRKYNGKNLGNGAALLNELCQLYEANIKYAGKYQAPIPKEQDTEELRDAAAHLAPNYNIKTTRSIVSNLPQFWSMYKELKRNKSNLESRSNIEAAKLRKELFADIDEENVKKRLLSISKIRSINKGPDID